MTKLLAVLVACSLASPAGAFSLFGKKKKAPEAPGEGESLPGMEKGGSPGDAPRMAQEEESSRKELGLDKDRPVDADADSEDLPGAGRRRSQAGDREEGEATVSENETAVGEHSSGEGGLPQEVVIRSATGGNKLRVNKPPLAIEVDSFESIRESLKPDQSLLLAESPLTVVWRRTHPEFLRNERVITPSLTTFSERPGIVFSPKDQLQTVLGRKLEKKESRGYQWSLTIADEDGKVFQHYEGAGSPPEEIVWSGENDQGEWIRAGRAYSPVYMYTDPGGTPFTRAGDPLRYKGVVHQERDGLHISLDSAILFGKAKGGEAVEREGVTLLRSAADLVKRKYTGVPVRVETYAGSKSLAERQAQSIEDYLAKELMLEGSEITTDSLSVGYGDQRVELILVNR
ncbi:MAG: hypothetical protein HYZ75_12770 [Elusimicrobia bacterium]|nr:hypothetical protein [Elusimicrobiota bacterium]